MPHRLLVLSLDGLTTAALAPYGASWCPTPALNRLASQSGVFDRCIVESDQPAEVLESLWSARVATSSHQPSEDALPWLQAALQQSLQTTLITDSVAAVDLPSAGQFANQVFVDPLPQPQACDEISDTALAQLFAAAMERLETAAEPGDVLWIHSDFLTRLWDAPRWLVPQAELEDEPWDEPSEEVELLPEHVGPLILAPRAPKFFSGTTPPQVTLAKGHDPDITLAWMNTYAAQVRLVDALLDVLTESLRQGPPTTLAVVGTSGFALGEHGAIGHGLGPLRSPRIQVPLLIRGPAVPDIRAATPCSPRRLGPTLLDCLGVAPRAGDGTPERGSQNIAVDSLLQLLTPERWSAALDQWEPRIVTRSAATGTVAHTAPKWLYVTEPEGVEHLYLKPDDRTDVNDVATRLSDVLERFRQLAT